MTKRIISLLLAALTAGSLIACTKGQKTTDAPDLPPEESAPALLTSGQGSPSSTSVSSPASNDQADSITLSEADMKLYQGSYDILYDRITDRGYAITSLTGTYVGMFTRDSSIQAMAHLSNGDPDAARAILRYLLSYHAVLGLKRGTHIVDEIKDEEYGNHYLSTVAGSDESGQSGERYVAQRKCEQGIYLLNLPNNSACQPFVPCTDSIYGAELYLTRTAGTDEVNISVRTDYKDPKTAIAEVLYTFGTNEDGWQSVYFETPLSVTPGKTYYLVASAPEGSGKVVWNGTTKPCNSLNSYNYDVAAFGGWTEKPYYLAYEILSAPAGGTIAQGFKTRGNSVEGVEIHVLAPKAGGKIKVELRKDYADPATALGTVETEITHTGEKSYVLSFKEPLSVTNGSDYYTVITLVDTANGSRILTDSSVTASSYASTDNGWQDVGYTFLASPRFDSDRAPLATLKEGLAVVQEIPCDGEIITAVRLLLSAEQGSTGRIKATLYKGSGEDARIIDVKTVAASALSTKAEWFTFKFDLPLFQISKEGNYFIKVEAESLSGKVALHGSSAIDRYESYTEQGGTKTALTGEVAFEALFSHVRLISDYTQTDATYMLIHAWAMYVNNNHGTPEDEQFIKDSYPIIKGFANYYLTNQHYNKKLGLILNPSLEHSKQGRYWIAYDLITNVFASQAFYELSDIAASMNDETSAQKWADYSEKIKNGIHKNLVAEVDGKTIYAEFYAVEEDMKFYPGISWVNFAPVAAEWYGMDLEIMKNTYEVYKKHATISMNGFKGLATDADLLSGQVSFQMIGKGISWELMFCNMIGDTERVKQLVNFELATAKRYNLSVYPEFWASESYVSDPGNQEHCSWAVYAMSRVFPELVKQAGKGDA